MLLKYSFFNAVKSCNYESQNNDTSRKYDRIIDDTQMEVSIEMSLYYD